MKRIVKIILGAVLAAACGAAYIWYAAQPLAVSAEPLSSGDLLEKYTVQGTVTPGTSLVLNAGENGVVTGLPFLPGMAVKIGDAVVEIAGDANTEIDLRLAQTRQGLSAARQEYNARYGTQGTARIRQELAQSEYDAAKWGFETAAALNEAIPGTLTETEMNLYQQRLTAAEQNLILARTENSEEMRSFFRDQIASWEEQVSALEKTVESEPVVAPFNGILWELYTEAGAYVVKYQPLAKLYREGEMKLEASVLTEDAMGMLPGDIAQCELADGTAFTATITYVSPVVSRSYSAIGIEEYRSGIELDPGLLPPGVGAGHQADTTFMNVIAENVLTAPVSAVVPLPDGGNGVYLIISGKAVLTQVSTGRKSGGRVELTQGVSEHDVLILNPFDAGVKNGIHVAPK